MADYTEEELIQAKKQKTGAVEKTGSQLLIANLDKLHTTALGVERIRNNLQLQVEDVVIWCREKTQSPDSRITRRGKNWYIFADSCEITVNAHSYTIITAHKKSEKHQDARL